MEIDPSVTGPLRLPPFEHFTLKNYDPHPHIKAAVSV
jgi:thymidylate synthase